MAFFLLFIVDSFVNYILALQKLTFQTVCKKQIQGFTATKLIQVFLFSPQGHFLLKFDLTLLNNVERTMSEFGKCLMITCLLIFTTAIKLKVNIYNFLHADPCHN